MKTVMIVAGESSGELYGSLLAKSLKSMWPDVRLVGIGGERMKDAGVEMLSGIASSFGLTETLLSLKRIRETFKKASKALAEISPDVVVLIDYPDFNFRIARLAKRHGLKVLYYVSPQVWAWRKGRVRTMGEIADRVAVILPFEEEIYRKAGISCEFVGHPVMEEIEEYERDKSEILTPKSEIRNRAESEIRNPESKMKSPLISLLPGSRPHELKTLLPVFVDLVKTARHEIKGARFIVPLAPNLDLEKFSGPLALLKEMGTTFVKGETVRTLASSDAAVVASGTATLQTALLGVPMVVVYKLSPVTYFVGKNVLDVKYISLVNIIPGRQVVSELIQQKATAGNMMRELKRILSDDSYREDMISSLGELRKLFSGRLPSRRVAEMTGEMAGWR
ncbi:MAG TPA: lipid-A-disaccharide synthase [Thermodesulfovibrionales bacterium]|nr:lipid-A-disaccharide synthase [Thermodesulfovibrionales bacterium]